MTDSSVASLARQQDSFLAMIHDDEAPALPGWTARQAAGMAVYRNNYRTALVDALADTFARTRTHVGEDAFRQAAAHHLITTPPAGWSIDDAGEGFDATCAALFVDDPEVAELAWLEWSMLLAFKARDVQPLDVAGFAAATAGFGETDWAMLRLHFMPGLAFGLVHNDLRSLWSALGDADSKPVPTTADPALAEPATCTVWREGERPVFTLTGADENTALKAMTGGATFGEACALIADNALAKDAADAAMRAGTMLGRWLQEGMIAGIARNTAR